MKIKLFKICENLQIFFENLKKNSEFSKSDFYKEKTDLRKLAMLTFAEEWNIKIPKIGVDTPVESF